MFPLQVPDGFKESPSGHYRAFAVEPNTVIQWRTYYGTWSLDLVTRDVYTMLQEPTQETWRVYIVSIGSFRGAGREHVERAYAKLSSPIRQAFYSLGAQYGAGLVVPIPTVGTMCYRVDDARYGDAWIDESCPFGSVERGNIDALVGGAVG